MASMYADIAEAIGKAWAKLPAGPETDTAMREMYTTMADTFRKRNGSFDRSLFLGTITDQYLSQRKPYKPKRKR